MSFSLQTQELTSLRSRERVLKTILYNIIYSSVVRSLHCFRVNPGFQPQPPTLRRGAAFEFSAWKLCWVSNIFFSCFLSNFGLSRE
ncbi:unnamed protein product [Nesidiocoris tenuis]|uniref:Uncharacterized protein n=1 Tax=Nesidiocoris tenuis TaxID=355587 RepID=A0A6H5G9H0_9HEMI|nr:unnamed protein product [Nesidiocoris tenuis]